MPKTDIDYSNTIIYKITCKDTEIKDVYVGHTTNFVQRKHAHKQGCNNPKSSNYDCKLYNTIREKGGWTNWRMEILNFFNCFDHYEARQKEQEYFVSLNANLNSIQPMPKPKEKPEDVQGAQPTELGKKSDFQNTHTFCCEKCNYTTNKKNNYSVHILTPKHKTTTENNHEIKPEKKYECVSCNKIFNDRAGHWRHSKKCTKNNKELQLVMSEPNDSANNTDLITYLMNENKELKTMIMEVCKNTNVK